MILTTTTGGGTAADYHHEHGDVSRSSMCCSLTLNRVPPELMLPVCVEPSCPARLSISQLSAPVRANESSMRFLRETDLGTTPMPHEKGAGEVLQRSGRLLAGTACRW